MPVMKTTKLVKRIGFGILVFALIVIAGFVIKTARAIRNGSMLLRDNQTSVRRVEQVPGTTLREHNRADRITIEDLGPIPSKLDSRYWLFFVDEQNGWFADTQNLWKSVDGGHTWKLLLSTKEDISEIFFSNLQKGWIQIGTGTFRTEDGGVTWTREVTPIDYPKGMIAGMYFRSSGQTGWVVGGRYKPVSLKRLIEKSPANYLVRSTGDGSNAILFQSILQTIDGGKTWRKQSLPDDAGEIFSLKFADDTRGVALGDNLIFFTNNDGKEWKTSIFRADCVDPAFIKFQDSSPRAVAFAENGLAWVSYDNGRLLKSLDNGETWCDLLRPEEAWHSGEQGAFFRELHFVDSMRGWGLKDNGTIFRTKDGGSVWSPIDLHGATVWNMQVIKDHALLVTNDKLLRITF